MELLNFNFVEVMEQYNLVEDEVVQSPDYCLVDTSDRHVGRTTVAEGSFLERHNTKIAERSHNLTPLGLVDAGKTMSTIAMP